MSADDWLREMSDTELLAVLAELEERFEQFDPRTRQTINDELRRRRMRTVRERNW